MLYHIRLNYNIYYTIPCYDDHNSNHDHNDNHDDDDNEGQPFIAQIFLTGLPACLFQSPSVSVPLRCPL